MPRRKTITVYNYDELDEKTKKKVLNELENINVDYNWWENIFDDAKEIGLEIECFDLGYRHEIDGKLRWSLDDSIKAVLKIHGTTCETYKIAVSFLDHDDTDKAVEELELEYRRAMLKEYLKLLDEEYNYRCSRESVEATIKANEYEFTKNGRIVVPQGECK